MAHEARRDAAFAAFFFRLGRAFTANSLGRGLVFLGGQFLNPAKISFGGFIIGCFGFGAAAFAGDFERLRGSGRGFGFRGGCRCFYRRGIIGCVSRGGITLRRFALGVFPWLPGIIAFAIPGSAIHRTFRRQVGLIFRAGFCLLHFQQALPIRHGDLVVIRVDFAKGQEAVAIAAIFHKGRLQAGFHPHHVGLLEVEELTALLFLLGFLLAQLRRFRGTGPVPRPHQPQQDHQCNQGSLKSFHRPLREDQTAAPTIIASNGPRPITTHRNWARSSSVSANFRTAAGRPDTERRPSSPTNQRQALTARERFPGPSVMRLLDIKSLSPTTKTLPIPRFTIPES